MNSAWREESVIPKRQTKPARKPAPGRLEAAMWFAAAVAILAWPREPVGAAAPASPLTERKPWWRRLLSGVWRRGPVDEVKAAEHALPGRGRDATRPSEIPVKGLKDVLWRTWAEFNKDRAPAVAAGVAFYTLLSTFPALAAFVSLYGLFANLGDVREHLHVLRGILPRSSLKFVAEQMVRLAEGNKGGLGLAFGFSLLVSLWSANAGMKALFDGLNIAYEEREKRGFIKLNLISLGFTLAFIVFALVVVSAVVALPMALSFFHYGGPDLMALLRWPLLLLVMVSALSVLYRYGPSREEARWRWVSWGSIGAAVLWLIASLGFSVYAGNFAHYDKTYGSLGAVVGFMTWIWLSVVVVLLGAELNAELEHQTAVDSTTGAPEPMGRRGAKMADTLGVPASQKSKPKGPDDPGNADPHALRAGAERQGSADAPPPS